MKFSLFKYATGVLYGTTLTFDSINPDRGPSIGGHPFNIRGDAFKYEAQDDSFTGALLDLTKWTDISSGTGSVATGSSHLQLNTGSTASSVGGIESVNVYDSVQFAVGVNIPPVTANPASEVDLFVFQMYVDANNHVDYYINLAQNGTVTLNCDIYKGGILVSHYAEVWTLRVSVLKILRWKENVYFYANGSLFYSSSHFTTTSGSIRLFSDNKTANYNVVNTVVSSIEHKTYVAFDDQVVHNAVTVSNTRLRGRTPPSVDGKGVEGAYAGFVDVHVVTSTVQSKADAYEYYYLRNLVLVKDDQFDVKFSDITDDTVKTPAISDRGLGGGK